jgi:hypothetical protein
MAIPGLPLGDRRSFLHFGRPQDRLGEPMA